MSIIDIISIQEKLEQMQEAVPAPGPDPKSVEEIGVHWYRKGMHDALRFAWSLCEIAVATDVLEES